MFARLCCVGLGIGALCLSGCENTAKPRTVSKRPTVATSEQRVAPPAEEPASMSAKLLAEQSQRDVQAILNAQPSDAPPREKPAESSIKIAARAPEIEWNDAAYLAQTRAAAAPQQKAEPQTQQPALAIVSAESPSLTAIADAPESTVAPPSAADQSDRLRQLLVELSRELYATGAYSEQPLRELAVIASMSMVDPDRRLDPQAIPDLTESERQLLGHVQTFFLQLGESFKGDAELEPSVASAATALRDALVKQPQLSIRTAALCTRVGGFGDYSCFERNAFLASSRQKVIVYLEIDEFTSELNASNEHVTQIAQQLTIYSDRDGIPVWKEDWQTAVDVSRNKRQDFFTVQVITIPQALSVGKYQLKIRARDEKSGAEAESAIVMEIVADARMAVTK